MNQNPNQTLIKLNSQIAKLTHSHQFTKALQLFTQINSSHDLKPDHYSFATTLTACANLHNTSFGNQLHTQVIHTGYKAFSHVANTLLSLYAKSNDLKYVKQVFDEIAIPDVYSRTTLLSAYTKLGHVDYACKLFEQIPERNVAMWNAIVTGCVENGCCEIGFEMFERMRRSSVRPDHYTFASILSLCCSLELRDFGRQLHSLVIRTGFLVKVSVVNAQLTMYFNCGMIEEACEVFEEARTVTCNQITFNAMIAGLVNLDRDVEALMMLKEMKVACFQPTEVTFVSIMSACSSARMMKLGQQIHADVMKAGFEVFTAVSNATMNMYTNCGDFNAAYLVFELLEEKDLVTWNSIIECYSQQHSCSLGIAAYLQMQMAGIKPDEYTIGSLLSCSELGVTEMIQTVVAKNGLISNIQVCNSLVCAFSKHGKIEHAYQVFTNMPSKNLISWNSIISGCLYNGLPVQALMLFSELQLDGIQPNLYTLSIILSSCASISNLRIGKQVHGYMLRSQFSLETSLANALITLYAKCGVLDWSSKMFSGMTERDVVSWNAMIAAYAQHGEGKEAIHCFEAMEEGSAIKPDLATFTIVLSACSHAGLVDEWRRIFSSMINDHNIEPGMDQYSCIIDLLGRAGHLDEAEHLINAMPFKADSSIWWALLSACISHVNVRLGRIAARFLLDTEPDNSAIYVLLSNLHAAAGQWEEATNVRELMLKNGVMKRPGCSWI
ncbi:hypothetical protein AQUCO_01700104v1 [Aquilegia coerulea]|uniref:Pentacotripeptide-repeat region of PRORP domain-containing protein n=1 Tax=Aquilegia coerulea TaxID=218851 RepID=A0A2G5DL86_AQUCA|nr:hypothetical protein AQUCO_01700104v1 [Aquilegia coerulea]